MWLVQLLSFVTVAALIWQASGGRIGDGRRIIGGKKVSILDFPYQAALLQRKNPDPRQPEELNFICGGSILSPHYVLTAAHCSSKGDTITHVRYASADRMDPRFTDPVKAIHKHPEYTGGRGNLHDIAILEIEQAIVFNNYVSRVTLSVAEPLPEQIAVFTGWGREAGSAASVRYLKSFYTEIKSRRKCKANNDDLYFSEITSAHVCAHTPNEGICKGDSGGPLIVGTPPLSVAGGTLRGFLQVGIASWGKGGKCADKYGMDIYVNVANYKKFIDRITQNTTLWGCQYS